MRSKFAEQEEARRLRQEGMPYKRIAARLGVSVGSVHRWTRDIALTDEQKAENLRGPKGPHSPERIARVAAANAAVWRERRRDHQATGRLVAQLNEPEHMAVCMLYWAEGSKSRNSVRLTNSDAEMLRFFVDSVREIFEVPSERFAMSVNVYLNNGLSIEEIESYWLDKLSLPRSCVRKHSIDNLPTSSSGMKKNKLPYGVCSVSLGDTRIVQHIYGAIQEYASFDEPRWLD